VSKMADNDPQQELKKRARRRLVGALALALAAAIVLPMVMDGEPKPPANALQIRIPSQEGSNFTSRVVKNPAEPVVQASSAAAQVAQSKPVVPVTAASGGAVKEPVTAVSKPEAAAQSVPDTHKPKAPLPEVQKPVQASPDNVPGKKPEVPTRDDARAQAILDGQPVPASPHADKAEVFYVQLGVYRDAENAKEVQSKAASHGVKSALQKVGSNTRVRSGPFPDRASADAIVAKLKQAGMSGFVASK